MERLVKCMCGKETGHTLYIYFVRTESSSNVTFVFCAECEPRAIDFVKGELSRAAKP